MGWFRVVRLIGVNRWQRWLRVGRVNRINTVVVGCTRLKNAVIAVAGLAVFCGALRLRLLFFMFVLPCILCVYTGTTIQMCTRTTKLN